MNISTVNSKNFLPSVNHDNTISRFNSSEKLLKTGLGVGIAATGVGVGALFAKDLATQIPSSQVANIIIPTITLTALAALPIGGAALLLMSANTPNTIVNMTKNSRHRFSSEKRNYLLMRDNINRDVIKQNFDERRR
jgi:hypothetical protein